MSFSNPLRKDVEELERFEEILNILFHQGFGFVLDNINLFHHIPIIRRTLEPKAKKPTPERVRETFEKLGPTFIKFGQILSERPDIIPEEYCEELEKLEDQVPAFDSEEAKQIVDDEVGMEAFEEFSEDPIAAASIAQVHKATLKSGKKVAVKVRRPGIRQQMEKDLDIIQYLAKKVDKHFNLGNQMAYKEAREFSKWTKAELDLEKEGRNMNRFIENLSEEKNARIPKPYIQKSSEKVLVMEFIDAVKVDDTDKMEELDIDQESVAETGLRSFLKQMLRDGFIHADPHPSNFLVDQEGNLVYLDFGMMAEISPDMQKQIGLLILYTYKENIDGVMRILDDMAYIEDDANRGELKRDVEEMLMALRGSSLKETSISKALFDLALNAAENGYYLPTKFILIGKGLLTMEGIGLKIYPELEFDETYRRQVEKLIVKKNLNPKEIAESFMVDLVENKDMISNLPSKLNKKLEKSPEPKQIKVEEANRENLIPPALILGSLYLLSNSVAPKYSLSIGLAGLITASYLILEN